MMHEVHIEIGGGERLRHHLPALRLNLACDPHGIPLGTECYEYPHGQEKQFESVADSLGISYAWGGGGNTSVAFIVIGTTAWILTATNGLTLVNVSDPTNLIVGLTYNLLSGFAVSQPTPSAIVGAGNALYVQNASDAAVPVLKSFFVVYDITVPAAMTQQGTIDLGAPTAQRAYEGNSLALGGGTTVYSLLGGDGAVNAAQLRKIDASNPAAPVVSVGPVSVGTFADQPRKLFLLGSSLYVLSGSLASSNQKVFIYNTSLVLQNTLLINDVSAQVGLRNFYVANGVIYMMAGSGVAGNTNLVLYSTAGVFLGATTVTTGPSGLAIIGA
jgi:hypothetical protein